MRSPEANEGPPVLSSWVKYEYQGNCASKIQFNEGYLQVLIQAVDPKRALVIREGIERIEGFSLCPMMARGWPTAFPFLERKPRATLQTTEDTVILHLNSQVIDGRIQQEQRRQNFDTNTYQSRFVETLIELMAGAIFWWGLNEIARKKRPLPEKITNLMRFLQVWEKHKKQLVTATS